MSKLAVNDLAVVCFGTTVGWYEKGIARMRQSHTECCPDQPLYTYVGEGGLSVPCPTHAEVNYGFKPMSLLEMKNKGYRAALWMDAAFWFKRDLEPMRKVLDEQGCFVQPSGQCIGEMTMDHTFDLMGVRRRDFERLPMISAGFSAFHFEFPAALNVFDEYVALAQDPVKREAFNGPTWLVPEEKRLNAAVKGHRHDQSVLSILWHAHGMPIAHDHREWLWEYDAHPSSESIKSRLVAVNRGM